MLEDALNIMKIKDMYCFDLPKPVFVRIVLEKKSFVVNDLTIRVCKENEDLYDFITNRLRLNDNEFIQNWIFGLEKLYVREKVGLIRPDEMKARALK